MIKNPKQNIRTHIFMPEEIDKLKEYRDNQKDLRLKIRFIALLLIAENIAISIVASSVGKSPKTVENWYRTYLSAGPEALNFFQYKPKRCYLTDGQISELVAWIREENPSDTKIIRHYIKEHFGVSYCRSAVEKLLKKHGLKRLRPKLVPGKPPSEEEQKRFVEEYNEIREFTDTGVTVLFCDAMHLVHQTVPSLCWGDPLDPPVFRTNSGRQRLNILGAYDPATHDIVHLTGEENCNAAQAVAFFEKILKAYRKSEFIVLILDNASYFHAEEVSEWLREHPKIICRFLPAYAPNLNLIERLWRFVKDKLVKNRYFEKYKTFRCNVFRLLNNLSEHKDELLTLMTEKFEITAYAKA